jgi:hypothetical protein
LAEKLQMSYSFIFKISGYHSIEYEDGSVVGYSVMWSFRSKLMFERYVLPHHQDHIPDNGGSTHL